MLKSTRKIAVLALVAAICALGPTGSLWAASKADTEKAKAVFDGNCKSCHGVDGSGTPIGKSLNAPDLRSPAVQKDTDERITDQITNGKGNMPNFKNILTGDQIHSLVHYVRYLGTAKSSAK